MRHDNELDPVACPELEKQTSQVRLDGCGGAAIMTGEYSSGLIRVTFTASPERGRVMLAKARKISSAWCIPSR